MLLQQPKGFKSSSRAQASDLVTATEAVLLRENVARSEPPPPPHKKKGFRFAIAAKKILSDSFGWQLTVSGELATA